MGGCSWKWKGGQQSKKQEWTARIVRRRDGRGRGGEVNATPDNKYDNNDNNNDINDNSNNNDDNNNNNTTIKQCTGVRGRRRLWQQWMMNDDKNGNCDRGTALRVLRRRNT
jgi:hypothetical protein